MKKIKVFIVDDSAVIRQVVGQILNSDPGIEVIGSASDPLFALPRMEKEWPDVILLDIEMPRMDGLTFLQKIMKEHPTPVVMCSTLTTEGSSSTMKALRLGAVEAVPKPKTDLKKSLTESSRILINAVQAASKANLKVLKTTIAPSLETQTKLTADVMLAKGIAKATFSLDKIIAIGTSTGGTQALETVLPKLPQNIPGIVVVQHMPEKFTAAFANRLNAICKVEVKEGEHMDEIKPGRVLIAPGGKHMMVEVKGRKLCIAVKDGPLVSRHRPSADVLFRSVAKTAGPKALGIIMTGMGDDGAAGLCEMREAGAATLGQNKETCVVYGMPAVAMQRGAVEQEVPLEAIADKIISFSSDAKKTS